MGSTATIRVSPSPFAFFSFLGEREFPAGLGGVFWSPAAPIGATRVASFSLSESSSPSSDPPSSDSEEFPSCSSSSSSPNFTCWFEMAEDGTESLPVFKGVDWLSF